MVIKNNWVVYLHVQLGEMRGQSGVSTLDDKLPTGPDFEVIIGGIISTVSTYSHKEQWRKQLL